MDPLEDIANKLTVIETDLARTYSGLGEAESSHHYEHLSETFFRLRAVERAVTNVRHQLADHQLAQSEPEPEMVWVKCDGKHRGGGHALQNHQQNWEWEHLVPREEANDSLR